MSIKGERSRIPRECLTWEIDLDSEKEWYVREGFPKELTRLGFEGWRGVSRVMGKLSMRLREHVSHIPEAEEMPGWPEHRTGIRWWRESSEAEIAVGWGLQTSVLEQREAIEVFVNAVVWSSRNHKDLCLYLFIYLPLQEDEAGLAVLSVRMTALRKDCWPTGCSLLGWTWCWLRALLGLCHPVDIINHLMSFFCLLHLSLAFVCVFCSGTFPIKKAIESHPKTLAVPVTWKALYRSHINKPLHLYLAPHSICSIPAKASLLPGPIFSVYFLPSIMMVPLHRMYACLLM